MRTNNRSYNDNNDRSRGSNGKSNRSSRKPDARASKFGADRFNMLDFGYAHLDETPDAKYEFKARVYLKVDKDKNLLDAVDGDGKGDNSYSPEETAALIAKALLEGRAINICYWFKDDGTWSGNARVDIKGLDNESEEEAPKAKAKAKTTKAKPKYEVPEADEDEEDISEDDDSEEGIPF